MSVYRDTSPGTNEKTRPETSAQRTDLMPALAQNVIETTYDRLPGEAVRYAKLGFLDTIGVLVAGSKSAGCQSVIELVRDWGGKAESTILIHGGKVTAQNAAMVNSIMARALDFDYVALKGMHLGASSIPTALAISEKRGGVSGKEFLAAVVAGEDLAMRIHLATNYTGFDPTGVAMVFGTTAIAGKLLGLAESEMLDALGIAFNRAGGSFQSNIDGSLAVSVIQGFTSKNGIESALLAQAGITGVSHVLQGTWGFFPLFSKVEPDLEPVVAGLGQDYRVDRIWFKRFPSCGATLSATEATLELVGEHKIEPEQVKEVVVKMYGKASYNLVGKPFEIRRYPEVDAQFSISYTVANAIVRKESRIEDFFAGSVRDDRVVELASRVHAITDREVKEVGGIRGSVIVEILLKDGKQHRKFVKTARGFPDNPLGEDELRQKFADCMALAPVALPSGAQGKIVSMIDNLEEVDDIVDVIPLLVA